MVKAGITNFLMSFIAKPTSEEEVVVAQVRDCNEVKRYVRLLEIPLLTSLGHDQNIFVLAEGAFKRIFKLIEDG
jgi:hypothetical protein